MSRATVVYIVMLLACVGGLWLIVRLGAGLTAPSDLSGVWTVGGEDTALPRALGETVRIEQSGRYLRLSFERGLQMDLKLLAESRPGPASNNGLELQLKGPEWSLTARGASAAGPLIFRLDGPETHAFTATRLIGGGGGNGHAAAGGEQAAIASTDAASDAGSNAP